MGTKVVTGKVRGSYVNVFRPRLNDMNGKEEYSMALLIPKTDTETVGKIKEAVKEAAKAKFGDKIPAKFKTPLRDGDEERPDDEAYKGHYFMNVKSANRPGIIDRSRQEVLDASAFVSGDYCRVSMNAYAFDVSGNRGVAFGLGNVQVIAKGEPLSNAARAEDEFDEWKDGEEDWG
jgi:hypothetical protein